MMTMMMKLMPALGDCFQIVHSWARLCYQRMIGFLCAVFGFSAAAPMCSSANSRLCYQRMIGFLCTIFVFSAATPMRHSPNFKLCYQLIYTLPGSGFSKQVIFVQMSIDFSLSCFTLESSCVWLMAYLKICYRINVSRASRMSCGSVFSSSGVSCRKIACRCPHREARAI